MNVKTLFILPLLFQILSLSAQTKLTLNAKSSIEINGTSTLHDWESEVSKIYLSGVGVEKDAKISEINSLSITVPAKSIKSGKDLMDDKTYEALMADKYPNLIFAMETAKLSAGVISGQGKITIAGKTKLVPINATYSYTDASTLLVKGSQKVDMLAFGVTPPTVLMGSITTGKDVTIFYNIIINY